MKKKILILDDKETIAKVLSIYLMSDYDVQWLRWIARSEMAPGRKHARPYHLRHPYARHAW